MALIKLNNQSLTAVTSLPAAISTGKVLQIQEANLTTGEYSSSGSWVTVKNCNITPSSTSSQILIQAYIQYNLYGNGSTSSPSGHWRITDNGGSQIEACFNAHQGNTSGDNTDQVTHNMCLSCLHSPNSTSQQTYSWQHKSNNGRVGSVGNGDNLAFIRLIEIGG